MQVKSSTISLTVADVAASAGFFVEHLGYRQQMAAEGFVSLARDDAAVDLVFLQSGIDVLPPDQRHQQASGLIVALAVADLDAELARLQDEGVVITLPLREEAWGERLFQIKDPNAVVVELVEWNESSGPNAWSENS
jgi:catechol 2,3-dioxygenase-like lactoylglutathione lyase family enzyme